jgi:hypothetical protein
MDNSLSISQKKKLVLSFSMGETSAFMTEWCLQNLKDEYEMVVVCANTGEELEESLVFADKCDKYFGWDMVWVEALVNDNFGKGTRATVVNFENASRNGEPFESVIAKYGIPNKSYPHCSRDLKSAPIHSYIKNKLGWKVYFTAIGIRSDEPNRLNWDTAKKNNLIYPLATMVRMTKPKINVFWNNKPFRLKIKGYEGNCKVCWKKSKRKLMTIAKEAPERFDFFSKMESKYSQYKPEQRKDHEGPIHFFRKNESVCDIFEDAEFPFTPAIDDRLLTTIQGDLWEEELDGNFGCTESCEPFINDNIESLF